MDLPVLNPQEGPGGPSWGSKNCQVHRGFCRGSARGPQNRQLSSIIVNNWSIIAQISSNIDIFDDICAPVRGLTLIKGHFWPEGVPALEGRNASSEPSRARPGPSQGLPGPPRALQGQARACPGQPRALAGPGLPWQTLAGPWLALGGPGRPWEGPGRALEASFVAWPGPSEGPGTGRLASRSASQPEAGWLASPWIYPIPHPPPVGRRAARTISPVVADTRRRSGGGCRLSAGLFGRPEPGGARPRAAVGGARSPDGPGCQVYIPGCTLGGYTLGCTLAGIWPPVIYY